MYLAVLRLLCIALLFLFSLLGTYSLYTAIESDDSNKSGTAKLMAFMCGCALLIAGMFAGGLR